MEIVQRQRHIPVQCGMSGTIESDTIYTPARAHTRLGYDSLCGLCVPLWPP